MTRMSPGLDRWRLENLDHSGTERWRQSFRLSYSAHPFIMFVQFDCIWFLIRFPSPLLDIMARSRSKSPYHGFKSCLTHHVEFDRGIPQIGSSINYAGLAAFQEHKRSEHDARKERETVTRRTTYLERDPRRNRNLLRRDFTSVNCQWMDKSIISGHGRLSECKDAAASSVDEISGSRKVVDKEQEEAKKPGESSLIERSNDAKAMAAFKFQLVDFVKLLLRPTWKEGHLSKEAYKEIVKKVADKVVATIEKPYVPQTQQKIDQYLSLSKPKINKLVQAYVENSRRRETRS